MKIEKPMHQMQMESKNIPGDKGGYFPNLDSSINYLTNSQTNLAIQADRVLAINQALKEKKFKKILDFGIGDGNRFKSLDLEYEILCGIDISEHMIQLCENNLDTFKNNRINNFFVGNQDTLDTIPSNTYDLILLIHVLGYIPEPEHGKLFENLNRILIPGGKLLISTGNKLFDLFALNSGTKDFFESEFKVDNCESLLLCGDSSRFQNADRINPLSFKYFLSDYGFQEIEQTFSQYHHVPPQILIQEGESIEAARIQARSNHINANSFSNLEKWRAIFQCSVVVSLSVANK